MINKVLIFTPYKLNKNSGGPIGFFSKVIFENVPENFEYTNLNETNKLTLTFFNKILFLYHKIKNRIRRDFTTTEIIKCFLLNKAYNYEYIYFHDIYTLYAVKNLIKSKQKVILQSHSPVIPSVEYEDYNGKTGLSRVKKIEQYAFNKARFIILPNEGCYSIYKEIITNDKKIFYVKTGIKPIENIIELPLSQEKINILYIGRRNEIKGFDDLIYNFLKSTEKRKDLRLFLVGKGEKIDNENIIDIGHSDIAYNWIKSMDFVISNNKSSYFDLNIIETLSIGTPLIMTTTEGHSYFSSCPGIIEYKYGELEKILLNNEIINKNFKNLHKDKMKLFFNEKLTNIVYKQELRNLFFNFEK